MSDLAKDKAFKLPVNANALSHHFDNFNGDFDTPEEFIRAYLNNDPRAIAALSEQNLEVLFEVLEKMSPEIRSHMKEETLTPERLKEYLAQLAAKDLPNPIP